jgi:hypothetical protein
MELGEDVAILRQQLDDIKSILKSAQATRQENHFAGTDLLTRPCPYGQVHRARTNTFETVSASSNSQQIILSTSNSTIYAYNVTNAPRSTQWLGQMSDNSLQQLSNDSKYVSMRTGAGEKENVS